MPRGFLSLPIELRLRIYDDTLINRRKPGSDPTLVDGDKEMILFDGRMRDELTRGNNWISPALLRTCRTIQLEASPILYAGNTFVVQDFLNASVFLQTIGSDNVRDLESVKLLVRPYPSDPWVKLLGNLAQNATGLRKLVIVFFAKQISTNAHGRERGLGYNPDFVRALANIQGLKKFEIRGYYTQHWLLHLEEKMSVSVDAKIGLGEKPSFFEVTNFMSYQVEVEDLQL